MKTAALVQVAVLLLLVALAASCNVAKEYSSRVFKPTPIQRKTDSAALTFMEFDSGNASDSVDIKELFSRETKENKNPEIIMDTIKSDVAVIENKIPKAQPIDATKRGSTRTKRVRQ